MDGDTTLMTKSNGDEHRETSWDSTRQSVSDIITADEIKSWVPEVPVIILAGTGTGKSHFIKSSVYRVAKEAGDRILMLIHRVNCVNQFRQEIENDEDPNKKEIIKVDTYQKIQYKELHGKEYDLKPFRYIVSDEFHYFIGDADYNNSTDVSFDKIMSMKDSIKIFMSATGEDVAQFIIKNANVEPLVYKLDLPKPPIGHLTFFHSGKTMNDLAKGLIEKGEKGIFFINSVRTAFQLYEEFSDYAVFNCSKKHSLYENVDEKKIESILENEKFNETMLITSTCMDSGINLKDPDLKHIIIDVPDVGSLIQCAGRKRSITKDDIADVYIKAISNKLLGSRKGKIRQSLTMANFLRNHTKEQFLQKYPRQYDTTGIVYDARVSDSKEYTVKHINELMFQKRVLDIDAIDEMIGYGEYGYCKFISRLLGKYNPELEYYDYYVMKGDVSVEEYLDSHVDEVMLRRVDRTELIKKLNVKRNRKLKRSREILNAALKEDKLPYMIEELETSRMVDGKKRNYKHAWRIVRHDWSAADNKPA